MNDDIKAQLLASCELAQASPELRRQVKALQAENSLLRAEVRALSRGRDEFDLDGDSLPAFLRPQA